MIGIESIHAAERKMIGLLFSPRLQYGVIFSNHNSAGREVISRKILMPKILDPWDYHAWDSQSYVSQWAEPFRLMTEIMLYPDRGVDVQPCLQHRFKLT